MKLTLIFGFICGALSWTVDLERIKILEFDVKKINNVESEKLESAKDPDVVYEDTEYARNYDYNQEYFIDNEMTNIVHNGTQFLETINTTFSEYKNILKKCINSNESRHGAPSPAPAPGRDSTGSDVCVAVLRSSGDVRRLVAGLFNATADMRDAMDHNVTVEDELESLVRVAWLLDRLARLTDLAPRADLNASHIAATTRAREEESAEILEQAENRGAGRAARARRRRRRSAPRALQQLASYYLKHKAWTGSNAPAAARHDHFDVDNHVNAETVGDRSIDWQNV